MDGDAVDDALDLYERYARGELPRFPGHIRDESADEDLERTPMFMTRPPASVDAQDAPAVAAMQALVYEQSDPRERARYCKEHGNVEYAKRGAGSCRAALSLYDAGLAEPFEDAELRGQLHANRAAAHLALGNHRSALRDCEAAVKCAGSKPCAAKVYFRAATAARALGRFPDAVRWCDAGLAAEPASAALAQLRDACQHDAAEHAAHEQRDRDLELVQQRSAAQVARTVRARGIRMAPADLEQRIARGRSYALRSDDGPSRTVRLEDGRLCWAVALLYVEMERVEHIVDFPEDTSLQTHLSGILADDGSESARAWDEHGHYVGHVDALTAYCETDADEAAHGRPTLLPVNLSHPLQQVLRHRRIVVLYGMPVFIIVSPLSPYLAQFSASHYILNDEA